MWNQRNQNEYDDWEHWRTDNQYYPGDPRDNWTNDSTNYCYRCGAPVNAPAHSHYPRQRYNDDKRRYNLTTRQDRSSFGSVFFSLAVIIALIISIASCNLGNPSASSGSPVGQNINIKSNDPIASPASGNAVYQVGEQVSSAEVSGQEINQPSQPASRTYVVKPGDTLYHIAVEVLGDGSRWEEIDQLNNLEKLSNGSVLIHPGQILLLPDE